VQLDAYDIQSSQRHPDISKTSRHVKDLWTDISKTSQTFDKVTTIIQTKLLAGHVDSMHDTAGHPCSHPLSVRHCAEQVSRRSSFPLLRSAAAGCRSHLPESILRQTLVHRPSLHLNSRRRAQTNCFQKDRGHV
jgi:hypothetical protein